MYMHMCTFYYYYMHDVLLLYTYKNNRFIYGSYILYTIAIYRIAGFFEDKNFRHFRREKFHESSRIVRSTY